jgi:hypothetical protein
MSMRCILIRQRRNEDGQFGNLKPSPQQLVDAIFKESESIGGTDGAGYVDMTREQYASAAYDDPIQDEEQVVNVLDDTPEEVFQSKKSKNGKGRSTTPVRGPSAAEILAESQKFKIFEFDSLALSHTQLGRRLRQYVVRLFNSGFRYLEIEADQKRGIKIDHTQMNKSGVQTKVPRQPNSWYVLLFNTSSDCGVYLIQYLERFMEAPDLLLPLMIGRQQRDDLWFETSVIAEKRKFIQGLMKDMKDDWILAGKDKKRELQNAMRGDSDDDVITME